MRHFILHSPHIHKCTTRTRLLRCTSKRFKVRKREGNKGWYEVVCIFIQLSSAMKWTEMYFVTTLLAAPYITHRYGYTNYFIRHISVLISWKAYLKIPFLFISSIFSDLGKFSLKNFRTFTVEKEYFISLKSKLQQKRGKILEKMNLLKKEQNRIKNHKVQGP